MKQASAIFLWLALGTSGATAAGFFDGVLTLDAEARVRVERSEGRFNIGNLASEEIYGSTLASRVRIGVQWRPVEWLKFYGQVQDSREFGLEPGWPSQLGGTDTVDLRQGWVEASNFKVFPLGLKIGRQVLNFGGQRLVGEADWSNLSRTFDAARLTWKSDGLDVDAFFARPVTVETGKFNESAEDNWLAGIYANTRWTPGMAVDGYFFQRRMPGGATDFSTAGVRVVSDAEAFGGWDFSGELATQWGEINGRDLRAAALFVDGGYTFAAHPWRPRISVQYNFATGDHDPSDGRTERFRPLFPSGYRYYGAMNIFTWANLHNPMARITLRPTKGLTLVTTFNSFWVDSTDGLPRRVADHQTPDTYVGSEASFAAYWEASPQWSLSAGYSHFFAGKLLDQTEKGGNADFFYIQTTVKF